MKDIQTANMILFGRSGAGKSSFINYLVGENVAPTGCGEPVTQEFDEYEFIFPNRFRLHIYDSKGLEVDSLDNIVSEIDSFIEEKSESRDPSKWIHAIFYCVNIARKRFESTEIDFIKRIQKTARQRVNIILTHCENNNGESVDAMIASIKERFDDSALVYCVNSKAKTSKKGKFYPQFGRELILKDLQELLWESASERIATDYAHEIHQGLHRVINMIEKEQTDYIDSIPWINLVDMFNQGKVPEQKLDKNDELIAFIRKTDADYTFQLKVFSDIFCSFSNSITKRSIKINAPYSFAECSILDESVEESLNDWVQNEIKLARAESTLPLFSRIKNNLDFINNLRDYYKNPIMVMCSAMRKKVPDQEIIKHRVKKMLSEAREYDRRHSPVIRTGKKVGRNEPCPCGSGKKFKHCHLGKGIYD